MKTLAIRLEDDQHAQLGLIAKLEELTVTDAIRLAIDQWIESKRSNPQLVARVEALLADLDREAANRREAITALISGETTSDRTPSSETTSRRSRSKGGEPASE